MTIFPVKQTGSCGVKAIVVLLPLWSLIIHVESSVPVYNTFSACRVVPPSKL
ncbi:MAG: hypothetical protein LBG59_01325 [Candidatus Peribacteria bacterium]|nr:hypothetical protein [Candidatus Peribacteria bacterium]